jgi:ACS family allantoate permease-like MFS transporter
MNGVAIIVMGLISFGVLHTHTKSFLPWQWWVFIGFTQCFCFSRMCDRLMIIMGVATLLTSVAYW